MLLVIFTVKKLLERIMKKNCKNISKEFRVGKVIEIKGDKLYVTWKGYNKSFNSLIKKRLIKKISL